MRGVVFITLTAAALAAQNFQPVGTIPGPADLIAVQGKFAYVASEKTVTIHDISDPAATKKLGSYTLPEKVWGFRLSGSLLYAADDFFGLAILDVSNPAAPALKGSFKTPGQAKNVVVYGGKALVSDHMSGLDMVDVSNPAKPVSIGAFFLDGYSRDVALMGNMAYAVDSPTGLYVLDMSKPGPPDAIGTIQVQQASALRAISVPESGAKIACVTTLNGLQVFDVSDASSPKLMSTFKTASGRPLRVDVKGTTAYVADGREGLQVVDVSKASDPRIVGSYKTASLARNVAVGDGMVFVVTGPREGEGEVVILRESK